MKTTTLLGIDRVKGGKFKKLMATSGHATLFLIQVVGIISEIVESIIGNWLYDKLKRRSPKLRIYRTTQIEFEGQKIRICIAEQIEKDGQSVSTSDILEEENRR